MAPRRRATAEPAEGSAISPLLANLFLDYAFGLLDGPGVPWGLLRALLRRCRRPLRKRGRDTPGPRRDRGAAGARRPAARRWEPGEPRGSRWVLRAPGGATPPGDSPNCLELPGKRVAVIGPDVTCVTLRSHYQRPEGAGTRAGLPGGKAAGERAGPRGARADGERV